MEEDRSIIAQRLLDHFGYLVISRDTPACIGSRLDMLQTSEPFEGEVVVVAEATVEDFYAVCDYYGCDRYVFPGHKYFYKVKAE